MTENAKTDPDAERDPSIEEQARAWDAWNAEHREGEQSVPSLREAQYVHEALAGQTRPLQILEVGCGTGWMCHELTRHGTVLGVDLSHDVLERAKVRYPDASFVAGDFATMELPQASFDVIVTLETLSHVADQPGFVDRIATLLVPGGRLLMATQNAPVLKKRCNVPPPLEGQLRHWVDRHELRELLEPRFEIQDLRSITPMAHRLPWRPLASWRLHKALGRAGDWLRAELEGRWWGWTLMVDAKLKPNSE